METIDRNQAETLLRSSAGKLVGVTFIKRSDRRKMVGTPFDRLPRRRLVGRVGVKAETTGAGPKYDAKAHGLVTLYEFVTDPETTRDPATGHFIGNGNMGGQYRNVPVEGIEEIRVGGKVFRVE